ncbi:MAG: hypothetical protein H0T42_08075, partial [Deltaproteobacteria bacterium]|nr:hypothetical protein [Deltaproteobacteria bacterium]
MLRAATIAALLLGACGTDPGAELVVRDATLGAGVPALLGADPGVVYWSVSAAGAPKTVAGGSLATLPTVGEALGTATGGIAQVGDHVVFSSGGRILRASITSPAEKVASATAETLAESADPDPILVWTVGAEVSWGNGDIMESTTLVKVVRCEHVEVTATSIYVAAEGTNERRLFRIDRRTGVVDPLTASSTHGPSFPGGETVGAAYRGRLVGADDSG